MNEPVLYECTQKDRIAILETNMNDFREFRGATEVSLKNIIGDIRDIKNNELRHLNTKINTLLFTVLASVFSGILFLLFKIFT